MRRPTLTVGMATYDDFDGVYFTVQALRLYHAGVTEIVVVDNNPQSPAGQMTRDFLRAWVPNGKYVPFTDAIGTSAPRDRVFREATSDMVACVDAHVLLWPGAVDALLDYVEQYPDTRDLLSGPMYYDDGVGFTTHFQDEWRSEMWGTWDRAWRCPCGELFSVVGGQKPDGSQVCLYQPLFGERTGQHFLSACRHCGLEFPDLPYHGHERGLVERGYSTPTEPFTIPAMGLGLFACRREAWLGFNPAFRGFGGEEFYIHEKYRQAGAQAVCLPALKWTHRFGRPQGTRYPLNLWNKIRNYVIGHRELGRPLDRVRQHFVDSGRQPAHEWAQLTTGDTVPELPASQAPPPASAPGCGSCNADFLSKAESLDAAYERAATAPSDINEHCPTLRDLASQCQHVTEFGVRHGVSTVALLAGRPAVLRSYDVHRYPEVPHLERLSLLEQKMAFQFVPGNSLTVDIDATDLLFIDTKHTAEQLYGELSRHAKHVRRWIALHDTTIFGERGEDGGPGLLPALRRFLREQPAWTVKLHHGHNHGLTVITRDPADKKPLPSGFKMALNFATALTAHVATGAQDSLKETFEQRLQICSLCDQRNADRCGVCGCVIADKAKWKEQECPLGKWN